MIALALTVFTVSILLTRKQQKKVPETMTNKFFREIDQQTGYTTHSLLCMPIFIRGK